jgi:hypothetical protein
MALLPWHAPCKARGAQWTVAGSQGVGAATRPGEPGAALTKCRPWHHADYRGGSEVRMWGRCPSRQRGMGVCCRAFAIQHAKECSGSARYPVKAALPTYKPLFLSPSGSASTAPAGPFRVWRCTSTGLTVCAQSGDSGLCAVAQWDSDALRSGLGSQRLGICLRVVEGEEK